MQNDDQQERELLCDTCPHRCDSIKVQKRSNYGKLKKHPETRTCSVTYHNKAMYQVSIEYVKRYWEMSYGETIFPNELFYS